jgi:hypothetical protein
MLLGRKLLRWWFVAYTCLVAQAPLRVAAEELSARQLIDRAPVIRSSDEGCRSIELCGYVRAGESACLTFRAIYRAPNHFALLIRDGADETPLLLAAEGRMLLYDPLRSELLWKEDSNIHFSIAKEGDDLKIHLDVTTDKDRPSNVLVDVKSLVAGPFMNDRVVQIGERMYHLTRTTEKGNAMECDIDLDQEQSYTNIKIIHVGKNKPSVCIESLKVNGNIDQEEFSSPKRDELAEKTCLRELQGGAMAGRGGGLTVLMSACYARAAINKLEMREAIEHAGLSDIDWKRVEENDKRVSHVLREALKTAAIKR